MKPWELDKRHRHPEDATSKFERWVREFGGPYKLSQKLKVSDSAVGSWIRRRGPPNLATAIKIIELSKGKLTVDDILEGTKSW